MYHFLASNAPTARPLQGMIGLGSVTSYYRLPTYSCTDTDLELQSAAERCAVQTPGQEVRYYTTAAPGRVGTKTNPYHVTFSDLYNWVFDPCHVKNLQRCPAPPPKLPPPVMDQSVPQTPTADDDGFIQHEVPAIRVPVYKPDDGFTQHEVPAIRTPVYKSEDEAVPIIDSDLQRTVYREDPVTVKELEEPEEPESTDRTALMVGGVLLLVAGGGFAYYLTTRKKRRR